ncbi:hypothetical protein P4S65_17495 [Pseudoalteromonas sp. B131b]|uniref:hypothetical protein n=1 Tax=unclassified Pseudoalteromonas TaxID=194690 RepID=UPI000BBE7650|nr:hypothetical protein [Pseudoalteromonas sp. 1_2015MBL_MicDiv]ATG78316.1 hypothetical protein AOR04_12710 [Pseudoalteromonas sp. 1_2015MBL_MicDiv]
MFRILFLLPILLCLGWYLFLRNNGVPIKQGKKGFMYILAFSVFVLGFFIFIMQITEYAPTDL